MKQKAYIVCERKGTGRWVFYGAQWRSAQREAANLYGGTTADYDVVRAPDFDVLSDIDIARKTIDTYMRVLRPE
jgi:hypothetical protein